MDISIVICCYNSSRRIQNTLKSLANLDTDTLQCEIVIVDNNCTDNTIPVVISEWKLLNYPFPLKIIKEERAGLSFARKCGVRNALGRVIVFCDDDNWLSSNYVKYAYNILVSNDSIAALCGQNIAISDVEFPAWFSTYQKYYAVGVLGLQSTEVTQHGWIWGAGMAFRKNLLLQLWESGFEHVTADRTANQLTTGGDVELCKWFILCGYKLWYEESISLYHFIESTRLEKDYLVRLQQSNETLVELFELYDALIKYDKSVVKSALYIFLRSPLILFRKINKRITLIDKYHLFNVSYFLNIPTKATLWYKIRQSQKKFNLINKKVS